MDMAPWRAEMMAASRCALVRPEPAGPDPAGRAVRARDALQGATQAALMMGFAWPLIAATPFFWAPPFFVMAGIGRRAKRG